MGQKVNPHAIRLGIIRTWNSTWYADSRNYADYLNNDIKVRNYLYKKFAGAGISKVQIERPARNARITIYAARPGVILGKKGGDVEALRKDIAAMMGVPAYVSIDEVSKPDLDSKLVAETIAQQLERRVMFRKAMKRAVQSVLRAGALGVKIKIGGRLGGTDIARNEWIREGRVPLHTFRADIDYGFAAAQTTYGVIGVKVWIYRSDAVVKGGNEKKGENAVLVEEAEQKTR